MSSIQSLSLESMIIPAEIMESMEAVYNSRVPSAFVSGSYYVAGDFPIEAEQMVNVPVGIQEHMLAPGAISIVAASPLDSNSSPVAEPKAKAPASTYHETINQYPANSRMGSDGLFYVGHKDQLAPIKDNTDAQKIAKGINKQSAKHIAIAAQKKNVSRRLLLAERSKKLTVVCPDTGIVSLIEAPAIPGFSLIYGSPFSSLANCRGIASRGSNYLRLLDTQVLAGILIILAEDYDLFAFMPADTGAQKNAILRTVGKDYLIAAIIFIEDRVHSNNARFLTKLSLRQDSAFNQEGAEVRMQAWLKVIAEEIIEPDTSEYDSNYVDKTYQIKPKYVEKKDSVSFLAKKEIAEAKKAFTEDKKQGKLLIGMLLKEQVVTDKLRGLLVGFMQDETMLTFSPDHPILRAVVARLEKYEGSETAQKLIKILTKNRSRLTMDVSEIEDEIKESQQETEEDDPVPGNEEAIEHQDFQDTEGDAYVADMTEESGEAEGKTSTEEPSPNSSVHTAVMDDLEAHVEIKEEIVAPAGLSKIQQILWLKKIAASQPRKIVQNNLPSTVEYKKPESKQPKFVSFVRSSEGTHTIGNLDNNKRLYFVTNDFGDLVAPRIFPHTEIGE